ncbi:DUF6602 domain-containing protein [Tenacibaculum ovolyticum]|uniref:DUF6602 domain-containing protein n=1 Tax=Tenacibaculum ovolyticum TaxID=104270 RepID=UPI003BAAEAA0
MNNLLKLLKLESEEINTLFEKASIEGEGTPQEISDRRESSLTEFLKKYFPFPYRIAKGNIRDSYGQSSMSIDCILLNPSHPFTTSDEVRYSVILADGVDVAIELKPKLNSDTEIERSLKQITSVKRLKRQKNGLISLFNKHTEKYKQNCFRIPSVVFATETYSNEKLLLEKILEFYEKESIPRELQLDFIVVNRKFIVLNMRKDSYLHNEKLPEGLVIIEYGDFTLAAFLLLLNKLPQSEARMDSTVLEHYLSDLKGDVRTYPDLNERIIKLN